MAIIKQLFDGVDNPVPDMVNSLPSLAGGAISSIIGSSIDHAFWKKKQDRLMADQRALASEAYDRQLDFWEKQNDYNSPSSQMSRLIQAGLNPALINSNGLSNDAGPLSAVGSQSAPNASQGSSNVAAAANSLAQILLAHKNMGFIDQQTAFKAQELLNLILERDIKSIARDLNMTEYEIRQLDRVAVFEAYYGRGLDGGEPTIKNNPYLETINKTRAERAAAEASASESVVHQGLMGEQYKLLQKQIEWYDANQSAMIAKIQAEVDNLDADTKRLLSSNAAQELLNERLDFQNAVNDWLGFDVSSLPDATKTQVYGAYRDMILGAKSPKETIEFVASLLHKAGTHERSILESWSVNRKFFYVSEGKSGQYNSND